MQSSIGFGGALTARKIGAQKAPLAWRLRNGVRVSFWLGALAVFMAKLFSKATGIATLSSALSVRKHNADGTWTDYGIVSYRVVTDAGVAFLIDDFVDASTDVSTMKYHGLGTGTTAESAGQTALVTECTTTLNPDSTRATGTNTNPSAPVYQTVGTLTFDGSVAITEHGIFSQSATGGGTLWDRSVFSAINLVSGESLQTTYSLTASSGG